MTGAVTNLTPTSLGGLRLAKVADMAPHVNLLIYGEPGVGKTLLCGSCDLVPAMRKVLILDIDGGALTVKSKFPNVERLKITEWKQLQSVYNELYASSTHGFQTVCLDTATEAQKINMVGIMEEVVKAAAAKGEHRDQEVPSVREWGVSSEQVRRMVRAYRDLPMNFLMTAHVKDDKDEKTGMIRKAPDLPGKLSRQIAGFFDIVLYMYVREMPKDADQPNGDKIQLRLLSSSASEKITAKDRTDKLPAIMKTVDMKSINALITGDKK
jgi:hypothetical protein